MVQDKSSPCVLTTLVHLHGAVGWSLLPMYFGQKTQRTKVGSDLKSFLPDD